MKLSYAVRPRRWVAMFGALVMALALNVGVAAKPAQAAIVIKICFPAVINHVIVIWKCLTIKLKTPIDPCLRCPDPYAIDFLEDRVLPAERKIQYLDKLTGGLDLLGQAGQTSDPKVRDGLRLQALDSFIGAAKVLGDFKVKLNQVGYADLKANVLKPGEEPWLAAAGTDISMETRRTSTAIAPGPPMMKWSLASRRVGSRTDRRTDRATDSR
jgi:hypothetical protein